MIHSENLEETALWKTYQSKLCSDSGRDRWIKKVYKAATTYLVDVRRVFQNYTLHDATHIINVLDAMGGILGDQIANLTIGEMELLFLVASLHDLGMVYSETDELQYFNDQRICQKFLHENCPEFLGSFPSEWPVDIRQWYLRSLHPFRVSQVLQREEWREVFADCPGEIVPYRCIISVCQAHGQFPKDFQESRDMEYLEASDTDPLFCALLLRLADLLDFDDTRAPKILYGYVMNNEKSRTEWDKHQISAGFNYPLSPSKDALPYKARCKNPGIEHAIRDFLDWVDDELDVCAKLQKQCHKKWQRNFPFPRMVSRKEIESYGYMSGDFCLTMDQLRIMELLAGQSLYEREDTFIRELLQNAMDATLLREEMDQDFSLEDARIDLWEWSDKDGNVWFRVDDMGIGMTLGMLQRYFLKVGNSYYSSKELKCDLRDHGKHNYRSISHFGIGFLSCFQCGTFAEISTLYFDSNKNRKETGNIQPDPITNYGLRLQVTGLTGYYTLKSQAEQHVADISLNSPDFFASKSPKGLENWGYRATPGTSIVIRLDPGRLGAINLHEAAEDYLCCARVPVYYNGVRVGRTYDELMTGVYEIAGERVYTLDQEAQKNFNKCFPSVCGQYPKVAIKVIPIDTEEKSGIAGLSGVIMHYNICFDKIPQWRVKDQIYEVHGFFSAEDKEIVIKSTNKYNNARAWIWYKEHFNQDALNSLTQRFSQFSTCPISPAQLGDAWHPFVESNIDIREVWKSWLDYQYEKSFSILLQDTCYPSIYDLSKSNQLRMIKYSYRGISAGTINGPIRNSLYALFLLDDKWKPVVNASRSQILRTPLEIILAISSIFNNLDQDNNFDFDYGMSECYWSMLPEWREIRFSPLGDWLLKNQKSFLIK